MAHSGAAPSFDVLHQIDRHAWALSRPNKPTDVEEMSWEATVRDEIAANDPNLVAERTAIAIKATDER